MKRFLGAFLVTIAAAGAGAQPALLPQDDHRAVNTFFWLRNNGDIWQPLSSFQQLAVNRYWELRDEHLMARARLLMDEVVEEFRKVLPLVDAALLQSMKFRIVADTEVNARLDPVTRVVRIPVGSLRASEWSTAAFEDVDDDPTLLEHIEAYIRFSTPHVYKHSDARDERLIFPLWRFAGRPIPVRTMDRNVQISELTEAHTYNTLAFLVGHEFCHLKMGHVVMRDGPAAIRQERDADACALALMKRAEFTPSSAITLLQWMGAAAVSADGTPKFSGTHPHPACRITAIFDIVEQHYVSKVDQNQVTLASGTESITLGQLLMLITPMFRSQAEACEQKYGK